MRAYMCVTVYVCMKIDKHIKAHLAPDSAGCAGPPSVNLLFHTHRVTFHSRSTLIALHGLSLLA